MNSLPAWALSLATLLVAGGALGLGYDGSVATQQSLDLPGGSHAAGLGAGVAATAGLDESSRDAQACLAGGDGAAGAGAGAGLQGSGDDLAAGAHQDLCASYDADGNVVHASADGANAQHGALAADPTGGAGSSEARTLAVTADPSSTTVEGSANALGGTPHETDANLLGASAYSFATTHACTWGAGGAGELYSFRFGVHPQDCAGQA